MEWIKDKLSKVGATRLFMTVFVLILLVAMPLAGISTTDFIFNVLVRIGMNGIMVLAMLAPPAANNMFGDVAIGEYFRTFASYFVIALSLALHSFVERRSAAQLEIHD